MVPELENARVTEFQVRMDCNGCVQRIKRAIHGIDGVYSVSIDFAQQRLTVVGSADPAKIVRAIKKTRKTATICSHSASEPPPTEPPSEAPTEAGPPAEPPKDAPPEEPPKDVPPTEPPKDAPPPENPAPEVKPSPEMAEIHMVHHYPHNYVYREQWNHNYPPSGHEAPYVTHSYSSYRPAPYMSEYGYLRSPPRDNRYGGTEAYNDGYYHSRAGREITTMFSDENPNACTIV